MKTILAVLALSALVAGPSLAAGKAANDLKQEKKDDKASKNDAAGAKKLYEAAAKHRAEAYKHHEAWQKLQPIASAEYSAWQNEARLAHHEQQKANELNRDASKLHAAEGLRQRAFEDRMAGNRLNWEAHFANLRASASDAKAAMIQGDCDKLKGDTSGALALLQKAVADEKASADKNRAQAKNDHAASAAKIADAERAEKAAAALEAPPVKAIVVVAKPAPKVVPIVIKAAPAPAPKK